MSPLRTKHVSVDVKASEEINPSFYECSPMSIFKKSFTKCKFDKIDIIQYVLYIIGVINCKYQNGTLIYFLPFCLREYNSIFVNFLSKNLHYINFFSKMFYHVFSRKINPGGVSIHIKKGLFPLKPPLVNMA